MMKLNFYICLFLAFIPVLLDCSNEKVIDEDKFVKIYTELVIVHDTLPGSYASFDSVKNTVFSKYGITSAQYEYTVNYYNRDVARWERFFNKATAYIDTLRGKKRK